MLDMPWLSLAIWIPIIGGLMVLFVGDREAENAKKLACSL